MIVVIYAENIVNLCDINFNEHQTKILATTLDAVINVEESVDGIIKGDYHLCEDIRTYEEFGKEILLKSGVIPLALATNIDFKNRIV